MRPFVLIADDFGLNDAIDAGILQLSQAGRLSGTSCLTQPARWPAAAQVLAREARIQVGLHINFSQSFDAHSWWAPLPQLIARAHAHALPKAKIRESLNRQWGQFTAAMGRTPDFVDGHQHVHQLPGIREALLALIDREGAQPWLRVTHPLQAPHAGFKGILIRELGAEALRRQALALGLRVPTAFAGVYDFNLDSSGYAGLFTQWLNDSPSGTVVMCHPGMAALPSAADPIAAARPEELAFFLSDAFADLLTKSGRTLLADLPAIEEGE